MYVHNTRVAAVDHVVTPFYITLYVLLVLVYFSAVPFLGGWHLLRIPLSFRSLAGSMYPSTLRRLPSQQL